MLQNIHKYLILGTISGRKHADYEYKRYEDRRCGTHIDFQDYADMDWQSDVILHLSSSALTVHLHGSMDSLPYCTGVRSLSAIALSRMLTQAK